MNIKNAFNKLQDIDNKIVQRVIKLKESASEKNLTTYAFAALASSVSNKISEQDNTPENRFLLNKLNIIDPDRSGWMKSLLRYLDTPCITDDPLTLINRELNLTIPELLSVALASAVENDVMAGRVLAHLQSPIGGSRPTLGLLSVAFADTNIAETNIINTLIAGTAIQSGLLTISDGGDPLPEQTIKVPVSICQALNNQDGVLKGCTIGNETLPDVPLPSSFEKEIQSHAIGLRDSFQKVLVIRTSSAAEGKSAATSMAKALNARPLFIETDRLSGISPWLILRNSIPVFCFELAPGERKILAALPYYKGPVIALCGPDGSVETTEGAPMSWTIPVPPQKERAELWCQAIGNCELSDKLSKSFRHGCGRIAHLGKLSHYHSILNKTKKPTSKDVTAASWTGESGGLEGLAIPLPDIISDDALVMTPHLRDDLSVLLRRCRARDELASGLGASTTARYRPGISALLVGPSGTGKTLAVGWLATKIGMPLFRVDLASITSKYIGETEKNLAQLLARAEQNEVILLFDEADSMFGKRTDVQQANDRFANAQTNYLLQRIENYDGITILTSNSRNRFDSAFSRRLDMIIEFPIPGPEERRLLWKSHLGENHSLSNKQINKLSGSADVNGGHIRNVVLMAAALVRTLDRSIEYNDIIDALKREFRKIGRQMPVELNR